MRKLSSFSVFKYFFALSRAKSRDHALERECLVIMICLACLHYALSYLIRSPPFFLSNARGEGASSQSEST